MRALLVALAAMGAAGCATKGAVRRVETEVAIFRAQQARADSARAAELGRIIALQQRILDSLHASREAVRQFRLALSADWHADAADNLATATAMAAALLPVGGWDEAYRLAKYVADRQAGNTTARLVMAEGLEGLGRGPEAISQYLRVLADHPRNATALKALRRLQVRSDRNGP